MKLSVVKSVIIFLGILLTGCAGTNFVRVADDALVFGQTAPEQISAQLGLPYREDVVTKNNQQMKIYVYAWASALGGADAPGVIGARTQGFYFFQNRLVGYEFVSSWKIDSTNFDGEKVPQIKKGESTRSDVLSLLGKPGGKYIYPVIPGDGDDAVNYFYSQVKSSRKTHSKQLVVTFNEQDIVTNVEYTALGIDATSPKTLIDTEAEQQPANQPSSKFDVSGICISEITSDSQFILKEKYQKLKLVLRQRENEITGTSVADGVKIYGTITGDVIKFDVSSTSSKVTGGYVLYGSWRVSSDGKRLTGKWSMRRGSGGKWNLTRVE